MLRVRVQEICLQSLKTNKANAKKSVAGCPWKQSARKRNKHTGMMKFAESTSAGKFQASVDDCLRGELLGPFRPALQRWSSTKGSDTDDDHAGGGMTIFVIQCWYDTISWLI